MRSEVREVPRPDGDPRDPYGILPDGPDAFCEEWGADTVAEALSKAENAPSTTPKAQMRRCPNCFSVKLREKKSAMPDSPQRKVPKFRCEECHQHTDQPTDPPADMAADELATFTDFEWIDDTDQLEDHPAPSFHEDLPDFEHGNRTEAIRRAIALTKPWSDDDGLTNREAAQYVPKGRGFVNYHRKKWREGQHDDLFTDEATTDDEAATVDTNTDTATATAE